VTEVLHITDYIVENPDVRDCLDGKGEKARRPRRRK
jgi:hypothetical protein